MDDVDNYLKTPHGKFLVAAHSYLFSAYVLRNSPEWKRNARPLVRPCLHLLGHGIELLLKFPIIANSGKADAKDLGHDLYALWNDPRVGQVRGLCILTGQWVWERGQSSGEWPSDDFSRDPTQVLDAEVSALSQLHGKSSGHALRYPTRDKETVPRAAFLIDTFNTALDTIIRNPRLYSGNV